MPSLNKHCINCEVLLEPKQSDFCSDECEQEYKEACDQELLTSLQSQEPAKVETGEPVEKTQEAKAQEFKQLLENEKE